MATKISERFKPDLRRPRNVFFVSVFLFALTFWVFIPSLRDNFLFYDENGFIVSNPHVSSGLNGENVCWAFFSIELANWHPLTWLSHMLDVQLWGLEPTGHHLTSVLLHSFNTVLVFLVFRNMTGAGWLSLFVAGLFGLHPLRVESVAWISERKDVLSTMFWLLTMWSYALFVIESNRPNIKARLLYWLTVLFFVFGLMSKTMLVTLPFVLLLLDYWPLNRWKTTNARNLILEKVPFFLLAVVVGIISFLAQRNANMVMDIPLRARLFNASVSYLRYLGKFFWPQHLCIYYPLPEHWPATLVLFSVLLLLGVSALAWKLRECRPWLLVGWCWYLGTLLPVIGLVQLCAQSIADRYTYVPLLGIYLAAIWELNELAKPWRHRFTMVSTFVIIVTVVCAALTRYEIGYWNNDETVWRRAIAVTKDNFDAHNCLAVALQLKRPDEALSEFQKAVQINLKSVIARRKLTLNTETSTEITVGLREIADANPTDASLQNDLGVALLDSGHADEAIACFRRALSLNPDYSRFKNLDMALKFEVEMKNQKELPSKKR